MLFRNDEHKEFYEHQLDVWEMHSKKKPDCYARALIYTLGICEDTRLHFESVCNVKRREIVPEAIHAGWQTSGSMQVTRLAFQLFTDNVPTAMRYGDSGELEVKDIFECKRYSVSDIFCSEFALFFVEAIKLRYPEYMRVSEPVVSSGLR